MVNMTSASISKKSRSELGTSHHRTASLDLVHAANRNASMMDDFSDEHEDFQGVMPPSFENEMKKTALEEPLEQIDLSIFSGNLRNNDNDGGRNCWRISDGNNFRVRSRNFCYDKLKIPGGKHLMDLVSVDWFKDTKRMDHVARRPGCAVQGSWIVRQSVGSTPCLLGKAVDCNYIRGPTYLEVDIDIGSSTVANGVLGLVIGVITSLVVDMAFLVQMQIFLQHLEQLWMMMIVFKIIRFGLY
ncbi:protein ENHANCED DISEASE RESISTANCE 2-like isoform X2 [Nicotiana sylvestris]|uniref:protein ENHANCED DISEASE RESISTANCE 2-like isoform X2 n=1 Tax=Nicotiana sylvestris TaxID=4096 RepID=UPI00388C3C8A